MIFSNTAQFVGQYDYSGDSNQVTVASACAEADTTCFGHNATRTSLGLETVTIAAQGYHRLAANSGSNVLRQNAKVDGQPYTVVPQGATAGNRALFVPATVQATYQVGGSVGDKFPFNINAKSQGEPLVELGKLFIAPGSKTANGNASFQMSAVPAGGAVYVNIHLLSVTGGNVEFTIIRDSVDSFDDDPETVETLEFDAAGAASVKHAGASALDWYDVAFAGDFTSFSAVIVVGVQ